MGNVWQARNFGGFWLEKFGKCYTSGDVNECLHIYGVREVDSGSRRSETPHIYGRPKSSDDSGSDAKLPLVIVEDPVSALRIGATSDSMPLLGSFLHQKRLNALSGLYEGFVVWLDADKYKEARAIEQRIKYMGRSARTIYTPDDPKCYNDEQIKEILG
jgi:hypothetical protein